MCLTYLALLAAVELGLALGAAAEADMQLAALVALLDDADLLRLEGEALHALRQTHRQDTA